MQRKIFIFPLVIVLIIGATLFTACTSKKTVKNDGKINVMVSILPQVDFVERIGGNKVKVLEMIPPGFSPATYDPSPAQLKGLEMADIYFRIGHIPFERAQMDKLIAINSRMKVVDTSNGIELLTLAAHSRDNDEHKENEIKEEGNDPHIWLSPQLVKVQAKHIYDELVEYSPENKEYFTENYNQFILDLNSLDEKLHVAFGPIKGRNILVFHPSFGYLADAYGFYQKAIEIEGKDPAPGQLQKIVDTAKKDEIKIIFVQAQFSTKSAKAVADEIGGAVIHVDPLAKNYFDNLELIAEEITNSFKK